MRQITFNLIDLLKKAWLCLAIVVGLTGFFASGAVFAAINDSSGSSSMNTTVQPSARVSIVPGASENSKSRQFFRDAKYSKLNTYTSRHFFDIPQDAQDAADG